MYDRHRYLSATLEIHFPNSNTTIMAYVVDPNSNIDYGGAVYYVVVVVLIYALSIVMMIASHIRKNQQDSQLRTYLKEMAILRKNDKREKIMGRIGNIQITPKSNDTAVKSPPAQSTPEMVSLIPPDVSPRSSPSLLSSDGKLDAESAKKTKFFSANSPKRSYLPNIVIQVIDENTSL